MPEDVLEADFFGFDLAHINLDASPRLPERLLSETEDTVNYVSKSGYSCTKWKHKGGALHYFDHVTPTREAWEFVKKRMVVDIDGTARISKQSYFDPFVTYPTWEDAAAEYREVAATERYVLLGFYGPLEATWRHHGYVETCMDLLQNADWVADMFTTYTELVCASISKGWKCGIRPDGLFLIEDLGTTQGTLMSPAVFRKLFIPCYAKILDVARAYGMSRFMHSDGRIHAVLDDLIEVGVEVLNPIDTGSGMDLVALKNRYGDRLTLYGGISGRDMHDVAKSNAEIDAKIPIAARRGGYIFHSDHSVPPSVNLRRYEEILQRVRALTSR
jgi:uroporphyrinogen decarboxylase